MAHMAIFRQLLAHTVIAAIAAGGIACFCPAEAADASAADAHAKHQHAVGAHGNTEGDKDAPGCGHERCDSDCTRISAASAKATPALKSATAGKLPQLDDLGFLPQALPAWPEASRPVSRSIASTHCLLRSRETPVRMFDRLLD